jgi:dTDP-L-rhamnose 4-epimerase
MKILITGGAGFIGTKLAEALANQDHEIVIIDNFNPQVHSSKEIKCNQLDKLGCNIIDTNILYSDEWIGRVGSHIDVFIHLASETGTGQSMYEIQQYCHSNIQGTAVILDSIRKEKFTVSKFLLASSRSIYGEGKANCAIHGDIYPHHRQQDDLDRHVFELKCPLCNSIVKPVPTDEDSPLTPESVYAVTKLTQEQLVVNCCQSMGIPCFALRLQNVYGPGQSLSNPYTGILSIFSSRFIQGLDINIFEDGLESRDFVYVDDVVNAFLLAINKQDLTSSILNIGSGTPTSVKYIAERLKQLYGSSSLLEVTGDYRVGDIRHNFADITLAKTILGYNPQYSISTGLKLFAEWVKSQPIPELQYEKSLSELKKFRMLKHSAS